MAAAPDKDHQIIATLNKKDELLHIASLYYEQNLTHPFLWQSLWHLVSEESKNTIHKWLMAYLTEVVDKFINTSAIRKRFIQSLLRVNSMFLQTLPIESVLLLSSAAFVRLLDPAYNQYLKKSLLEPGLVYALKLALPKEDFPTILQQTIYHFLHMLDATSLAAISQHIEQKELERHVTLNDSPLEKTNLPNVPTQSTLKQSILNDIRQIKQINDQHVETKSLVRGLKSDVALRILATTTSAPELNSEAAEAAAAPTIQNPRILTTTTTKQEHQPTDSQPPHRYNVGIGPWDKKLVSPADTVNRKVKAETPLKIKSNPKPKQQKQPFSPREHTPSPGKRVYDIKDLINRARLDS